MQSPNKSGDTTNYHWGYFRFGLSGFLAYSHPGDEVILSGGFTFAPGFYLVQSKNYTVSLSAPITLGGGSNYTYSYGVVDLPAMLDLHFGSASEYNYQSTAGLILGIGVGRYYSYNIDKSTDLLSTASLWGPRYQAGFSFGKSSTPTLIMIHYGESFGTAGGKIFGLSVQAVMRKGK